MDSYGVEHLMKTSHRTMHSPTWSIRVMQWMNNVDVVCWLSCWHIEDTFIYFELIESCTCVSFYEFWNYSFFCSSIQFDAFSTRLLISWVCKRDVCTLNEVTNFLKLGAHRCPNYFEIVHDFVSKVSRMCRIGSCINIVFFLKLC